MDIAAMSMNLSQAKMSQMMGLSVMKIAMDTSKENASMMNELLGANVQAMERSVTPHLGNSIDIKL